MGSHDDENASGSWNFLIWLRRVDRQRNLAPQCGQESEFSMCTLRCCFSKGRALNTFEQKEQEKESAESSLGGGGENDARGGREANLCLDPGIMLHTARWYDGDCGLISSEKEKVCIECRGREFDTPTTFSIMTWQDPGQLTLFSAISHALKYAPMKYNSKASCLTTLSH